ncbi:M56 family metallopeptidase [Paraconexibacter antarcticus]|uniref:M56 family metallopeptidase n=1 Tax=Paraconexibacter antarcticus TaxID=2949664 RepID=A0ABY5DPN1_9ACTN|nr:M56 family metallopeptidase [Paraconexibacter antarcticus]UTI63996.1 M56 family metallopeptidase [Paraconexibacter antarcticus]
MQLGLGALAAAAAALAATTVLRSVNPGASSWSDLQRMCITMLGGASPVARVIILALAGIGLAVPVRGASSIFRQLTATRRFLRSLTVTDVQAGSPSVVTVADDRPLAFCAGVLRPRIYLSTGTRRLLPRPELDAVIAHESHHAQRRDPLRMLIVDAVRHAMFFLPVLGQCRTRYGSLTELAADERAIATVGVRPLAGALAMFDAHGGPLTAVSAERVDHLLGERHAWQISPLALIGGLWSIAGIVALAITTLSFVSTQSITMVSLASTACGVTIIALPVTAAGLAFGLIGPRYPR